MFDQKTIDRFWIKVRKDKENKCWLWLACKDKDGYGKFEYQYKNYYAHVFSFMIENNIILTDNEVIIRHLCNNPACVNPKHLQDGIYKENAQDAIKAGTYIKGEKHYRAKFTEKEIKRIRRLGLYLTAVQILRLPEYKNRTSRQTIWSILKNETWKHI